MILDLSDGGKRDLDNLPVRDLNLDAGCREGLGCLHALDFPAHAPAIGRDDLHVIFSVKWLQCRKRLGYLHSNVLPRTYLACYQPGSLPSATAKRYLAYRNLSVYLSLRLKKQVSLK